MNRRRFLAATGLALGVPTIIPASALGLEGKAAPSERVTMGVVGWGMQGPANTGEFLRLKSLTDRGCDPLAYRYLCLTAHYRGQLNFTWDALDAAATALDRMRNGIHALRAAADAAGPPEPALVDRFTAEINDDLNLPRALAVAWEVLRGDLPPAARRATLTRFDEVLGLGLAAWEPTQASVPDDVRALAESRLAARRAKNWAEADRLRAELNAAGWEMKDGPDGYDLRRR